MKLRKETKAVWTDVFPMNFVKFLRIPFLTELLRWVLLKKVIIESW